MNQNDNRLSLDPSLPPPTKEDLYQELNELLSAFCSEAQQQFCIDQEIITREEIIQIKNTVQQIQQLLPTMDHHNNHHLRQTLTFVLKNILHYYEEAMQQRSMAFDLNDILINQYISEWHKLNKLLELKKLDHQHLPYLLNDLSSLARLWKHSSSSPHQLQLSSLKQRKQQQQQQSYRFPFTKKKPRLPLSTFPFNNNLSLLPPSLPPSQPPLPPPSIQSMTSVEDILTSILASYDFPMGAYMVIVDKHNYGQLGFPHKKIGTKHIVFDSYQLSLKDILLIITDLCDRFGHIFSATAQQHLSQTDTQLRKSKPTFILNQFNRLSSKIINSNSNNRHKSHHYKEKEPTYLLSPTTTTTSSSSFRLSLTSPHTLTLLQQHPIPIPSFIPPPWMWPDLIKLRYPYDPYLFGLIRRHTTTKQQQQSLLRKQLHTSSFLYSTISFKRNPYQDGIKRNNNKNRKIYNDDDDDDDDDNDDDEEEENNKGEEGNANIIYPTTSSFTKPTNDNEEENQYQHAASKGKRNKEKVNHHAEANYSSPSEQQQLKEINMKQSLSLLDASDIGKHTSPYTSVSIEHLCFHLSKVASQFYNDLWTHTKLRYQENDTNLQSLEWNLVAMYRHLQIASSKVVMERAFNLVQDIDRQSIHLYQQHQYQQQRQRGNQEEEEEEEEGELGNEIKKRKKEKEKNNNNHNKINKDDNVDLQHESSISSLGEYILDQHHYQQKQQQLELKKNKSLNEQEVKPIYSNITYKTDTTIPFYQTSSSLITPMNSGESSSSTTIPNILINDHHPSSSSSEKQILNHKRHSLEKQYKQTIAISPS